MGPEDRLFGTVGRVGDGARHEAGILRGVKRLELGHRAPELDLARGGIDKPDRDEPATYALVVWFDHDVGDRRYDRVDHHPDHLASRPIRAGSVGPNRDRLRSFHGCPPRSRIPTIGSGSPGDRKGPFATVPWWALALDGCHGQNLIYGISVPPGRWWPSQKEQVMPGVVVGIDGSEQSQQALDWAIKEAALRNAPLTVLAVHQVAGHYWTGRPEVYASDQPEADKMRQAAQDVVQKAIDASGGTGPASVTVRAVSGIAAQELINASSEA